MRARPARVRGHAFASGVALVLAMPAATAAGDGSAAFDQYCIGCHGPDGRGVANLGVDLVASPFVAAKPEAALVEFLKAGRPADDPESRTGRPMPGFAWVTEGELRSIAAFLKAQSAAQQRPAA